MTLRDELGGECSEPGVREFNLSAGGCASIAACGRNREMKYGSSAVVHIGFRPDRKDCGVACRAGLVVVVVEH